jgi:NAD(P)H-hydrate epimerase
MTDPRVTLGQLFRAAAQAHHQAFAATDGEDPDWPEWYAGYLANPLSELLGCAVGRSVIADDLRSLERKMQTEAPTAEWTLYYADWFLARHSAPCQ